MNLSIDAAKSHIARPPTESEDVKKLIAEMRARDAKRKMLIETEPECVKLLLSDGSLLDINPSGLRMIEADSLEQVKNRCIYPFVHEDERAAFIEITKRAFEGNSGKMEYRVMGLKGGTCWVESHSGPFRDESGNITAVLNVARDITERKNALEMLRAREQHLTSLINSVDGVVWESDAQTFQLTYISPRAERMLGYPLSRWMTEPDFWITHVHPADRERVREYNLLCTREKRGHEYEYRMIAADGSEIWVRDIIAVVVEDGLPTRLRGIMVDITPQKERELRIKKLNRTYAVLSASNQLIARADGRQRILDGACRIAVETGEFLMGWIGLMDESAGLLKLTAHTGATPETVALLNYLLANPKEGCAFTARAVQTGASAVCNDIATDPLSLSWRDYALKLGYRAMASFPLVVEGRTIGAFNLYASQSQFFNYEEVQLLDELAADISLAMRTLSLMEERHRAEEALKQSEERYKLAERAVDDGLWDWNILTGEQYLSPRWKEIIGYRDDELPNEQSSFFERIHPDDKVPVYGVMRDNISRQERFASEFRMRHKDGSYRWVLARGEVARDADGRAIRMVGAMTDITARRAANDELRHREEHFRRLIENASDLITAADKHGVIFYQSPAAKRSLGFDAKEMEGRKWSEFVHAEDVGRIQEAVAGVIANVGTSISVECRVSHKLGEWRILQSIGKSVAGAKGEVIVIFNSRDITETRRLEDQLRQSQKMEAIGQLAGGIAHDFNNILGAIIMQAEVAAMVENVPAEVKDGLEQVCEYAERAARLIRQLLVFGRKQVIQPSELNINEVIGNLAKMLKRIIGEDIRLGLDLHPSPLTVRADPAMLDQVLLNLAVNARDAMASGGELRIGTSTAVIDEAFAKEHPDAKEGVYVCVSVSDTGVGIAAEILPRIFEPFFTTKQVGKGSGLGLATIFGIVKQHDGRIDVSSVPGSGTTFRILLPLVSDPEKSPVSSPRKQAPGGGTETVLLVEDEVSVRDLTRIILTRFGYQVIEACSGVEALATWTKHRDSVSMLITDLVMPGGISGHQLARELLADKQDLKVVFMSGYSEEIAGRELEIGKRARFIQKPFQPAQFLETVRSLLDS